jgi:hypothetical protein
VARSTGESEGRGRKGESAAGVPTGESPLGLSPTTGAEEEGSSGGGWMTTNPWAETPAAESAARTPAEERGGREEKGGKGSRPSMAEATPVGVQGA